MVASWVQACSGLEPSDDVLTCNGCLPACVADLDPKDLAGTARRLGCDPDLVVWVSPTPGWAVREPDADVEVELSVPVREPESGRGCDGPIRLSRLGRRGEAPDAVAADIVTHASIKSMPLWPTERSCVDGSWSADGTRLRFSPSQPLERQVWFQVEVPDTLDLGDARLCSALSWRFTTSACGDGVVQHGQSIADWVCLGKVEASRGWFQPFDEQCDDGNDQAKDGCSLCVRETGWSCDGDACHTRCGDGIIAGDEQCDFGVRAMPGCDASCQLEPGFSCDAAGCAPIGGDGAP
ncbi:MAG TPA: DUF4215 domain-containing protein [Polyangiales bacterium]|nr:DUF4215 domain-containing protein [Polyangiales bacterium]